MYFLYHYIGGLGSNRCGSPAGVSTTCVLRAQKSIYMYQNCYISENDVIRHGGTSNDVSGGMWKIRARVTP